MDLDKSKTVSFSGYRPHKFEFPLSGDMYDKLVHISLEAIFEAIKLGYSNFIVGGASGYDIICSELLRIAKRSEKIKIICALPYSNFVMSKHFDESWRSRYEVMATHCDEMINVTGKENETKGCYQQRNEYMIDNSSRLICYHKGKSGGTANTIKYAKAKNLDIINVAKLF